MVLAVGGVYVFIFRVDRDIRTTIGSLGSVHLVHGVYGYVGSARGAGGVRARVLHHIRKEKRRVWWHIDYLTTLPETVPMYVVYAKTSCDVESLLAHRIGLSPCWSGYTRGFGSSDKDSYTHLYLCSCSEELCIDSIAEAFSAIGLEPIVEKVDDII
ncbi:MAG: GIY-YIG nuclease family protein [Ignisphaera sp.]